MAFWSVWFVNGRSGLRVPDRTLQSGGTWAQSPCLQSVLKCVPALNPVHQRTPYFETASRSLLLTRPARADEQAAGGRG